MPDYTMRKVRHFEILLGLLKLLLADVQAGRAASDDWIERAISAVARGEAYVSPALSGFLLRRRERTEQLRSGLPLVDLLTTAEKRVLRRIAAKRSTKEIAAEFHLSPRTVEAHRQNIRRRLELGSLAELIRYAVEHAKEFGAGR